MPIDLPASNNGPYPKWKLQLSEGYDLGADPGNVRLRLGYVISRRRGSISILVVATAVLRGMGMTS